MRIGVTSGLTGGQDFPGELIRTGRYHTIVQGVVGGSRYCSLGRLSVGKDSLVGTNFSRSGALKSVLGDLLLTIVRRGYRGGGRGLLRCTGAVSFGVCNYWGGKEKRCV